MRGIVFGSGASIDLLPDSFFEMIRGDLSFGVNRVVLSKRLSDANFSCNLYGGFDRYHDDRKVDVARKTAYSGMLVHQLYLPDDWFADRNIKCCKPPEVGHNSCEMAAKILVKDYGCTDLWLVGCEVIGPHCKTDPWMDPYETNCDGVFAKGAANAWGTALSDLKVPVRVYPKWSLLHPYVTPHSISVMEVEEGKREIRLETAAGR